MSDDSGQPPSAPPLIFGRYALAEVLGEGGSGEVWAAEDRVLQRPVVVKRFLPGVDRRFIAREATALRLLRVPGVPRLLDEGDVDGCPVWVLERVDGLPFPGRPCPVDWEALKRPLRALLLLLDGLHARGVFHLDLTPEHVRVDERGRLHLLDFGLATGPGVEARPQQPMSAGTLRYAAPERILSLPVDHRADLYSVGVMVFEALTSRLPQAGWTEADGGVALRAARVRRDPTPLRSLMPTLPESVCWAIDHCLSRDLEGRPETAVALREALGLEEADGPALPGEAEGAISEESLRGLFAGPDRFLHTVEDGARSLWRRTGGRPDLVRAELRAWARLGFGQRGEGGRFTLDRAGAEALGAGAWTPIDGPPAHLTDLLLAPVLSALTLAWPATEPEHLARALGWPHSAVLAAVAALEEVGLVLRLPLGGLRPLRPAAAGPGDLALHARLAELAPLGSAPRLRHWLYAGRAGLGEEALVAAADAHRAGRIEAGVGALTFALAEARAQGHEDLERSVLRRWAAAALSEGTPIAIERVRAELSRPGSSAEPALDELMASAALLLQGELLRARERLARLGPPPPPLSQLGRMVRAQLAFHLSGPEAEREIAELCAEVSFEGATGEADEGMWLVSLRGRSLYRSGRYTEAARLQEALASRMEGGPQLRRIIAYQYAASAWLEAGALADCRRTADVARREAAAARAGLYEARATWLLRAADYREGLRHPPDEAVLQDAAALDSPVVTGFLALTEAAFAWRIGAHVPLLRLAEGALAAFTRANLPAGQQLAAALRLQVVDDPAEALARLREAEARALPDIDWQVMALLASRCESPSHILGFVAERCRAAPAPERRREVLSPAEALALVLSPSAKKMFAEPNTPTPATANQG